MVMQIHSLDLVDDYTLIGIHTSEEDFRLAYLLNSNLQTKFTRSKFNLDFENKRASFPIFEFINEENQLASYLISNKCIGNTSENSAINLFSKDDVFFIQDKKQITYVFSMTYHVKDYNQLDSYLNESGNN